MILNPKVVSDKFEDEIVVVNLESGAYYSLKDNALDIWLFIEKQYSKATILQAFQNLSSTEENQLKTFLNFLEEEKLIIPQENTGLEIDSPEIIKNFTAITYAKYDDMSDLIMLDPIHEVDEQHGWPKKSKEKEQPN